MENFSDELRTAAAPIWDKIFKHPFLIAIKNGTLPIETFRYYLTQDYLYLEGFARTVAMALAKAPDSETLEELSHRVLTPVERPLHHKLLAESEVTLTSIYEAGPSPTNTAYVNHMVKTASLYGLGPTAAALLPCPWTYHLLKDEVGASDHPLYSQWTEFYVAGFLSPRILEIDAIRIDSRVFGSQNLDFAIDIRRFLQFSQKLCQRFFLKFDKITSLMDLKPTHL